MNLLNPRQIEFVLTSRLPGFKVTCTSRKEDVISLCIRDMQTQEVFGVAGIRLSAYKGRYGALILAKILMEDMHRLRNRAGPLLAQTCPRNAYAEHKIMLSLIR